MNNVFGLDIGTRNVVGTVGHRTEDGAFIVEAQYVRQHETRSMLDGQIHDIGKVARTISAVKAELEAQLDAPLSEVCIAAAGRVLKTVTTHVEYEYAEESVVTGEDIHTLNLLGVEQAQDILREQNDTKYKFYCVGYSVVKYYLNEEVFISIEGHKANKIGEDIIVTFLPEDVVDGLYSAVGQAKMTVANMTLEPIAAINVAIPENFRMLNIALVDVGAGTSDISITREGSIIAYGMIPYAGDELTELIVQQYLVDFQTAEKMKLASSSEDEVTYEDIMSISHTIPSKEIWELVAPTVEKITSEVAAKIKELNGDKTVSACFVVGGGGKIHGFTEKLAGHLDLPTERVALRGEEVLKEVTFEQEDIKKDPLLVTPIGICLNYYEQKNNFMVFQIGVAQHIASAGDLQAAIPRTDLLGSVRNRKICADILDLRTLEPCFCNHLHRRPICSVKYQHAARKSVCHLLYQRLDLLRQKVVEHPGRKEHRAARCIDFCKPLSIIQIAGDIFLTLLGGQKLVAHGYDIGKVQIVNFTAAVITAFSGAVQPAAQIDHRRIGVRFQIIPHLKSKVILPQGHLQ